MTLLRELNVGDAPPSRVESRFGRAGLSLIELVIVMAVLAALSAIIIPNVSGFLGKSKESSYNSDTQLLQVAVDSWRTDIGLRSTTPWPILEGGDACIGTVNPITGALNEAGCNPYLDVAAIATQGYIRNASALTSADKSRNTTATNTSNGSYGWYIDGTGIVKSVPNFLPNTYP